MRLKENDIHLWLIDLQQIDQPLDPRYWQLLNTAELHRNRRYRFEALRVADCATRALVRTVLSRYTEVAPADWQFSKGEHGKPEIRMPAIDLPLRFNVSHTKRYIVCAVGLSLDLGVDIEFTACANDVLSIAEHYFSEKEVRNLFTLPAALREDRFFDYWTLKEAYMKACGEGISLGLGNFSFHLDNAADISNRFAQKRKDDPADWWFWLSGRYPDHRLALAVRNSGARAAVRLFETVPLQEEYREIAQKWPPAVTLPVTG